MNAGDDDTVAWADALRRQQRFQTQFVGDFVQTDADRTNLAFLTDPARAVEARSVAPLVAAFTEAQSTGTNVGAFGPNIVQPIHEQLGRKFAKSGSDGVAVLRAAVRAGVAAGYLVVSQLEADGTLQFQGDDDLQRAWHLAVANHRGSGIGQVGIGPSMTNQVQTFGMGAVIVDLREAGWVGRRTGVRLEAACAYCGHFGALLRLAETTFAFNAQSLAYAASFASQWPYPSS